MGPLFGDRLTHISFVRILRRHDGLAFRTWHDLEAGVELDHGRSELLQDTRVALHFCGTVRNLGFERFGCGIAPKTSIRR